MPNLYYLQYLGKKLLTTVAILCGINAFALEPENYVSNSVLAEGNWAKIEVNGSGMHFISDATLKSLGFQNPETVNVYGFGGRMMSETPGEELKDDLPAIPSLLVNGGIVFFGHGSVKWNHTPGSNMTYKHVGNPYSDKSYYFISDSSSERTVAAVAPVREATGTETISYFTERMVHEQDILPPSNTGRLMLGEDFKSTPQRSFRFSLPDNTGNVRINTAFGSKTSGGVSSIVITANGNVLAATSSDQMTASDAKFITTTSTVKEISNPGEMLDLTIRFNGSGTVSVAALDYIELEYQRKLKLKDGELYFYLSPLRAGNVIIENVTGNTIVWDVTDPTNPLELKTEINGSTLSFVSESGYREYVAFDPSKVSSAAVAAGKVNNQNIHALEAPGMLLITPEEYKSAAQRLVALHEITDGLSVLMLTPEEIYNEFSSGNPDLCAFRNLLKMWYDRAEGADGGYTEYCLIMSRPTYDNKMLSPVVKNAGYPRIPIWQTPSGETESNSYSTDDFIGMLEDVKTTFNIGNAKIHVAVGRMPVKSLAEANSAVDKLENYLLNPDYGSWRKSLMVIADDGDSGVHLEQAENSINSMRSAEDGDDYFIEKLYLDSFDLVYTGTGATYPDATARLLGRINEGVAYIDYIGHANTKSWGHESLMSWSNFTSLKNERLPFIFAATCEFLRWDDDEVSAGEEIWLNPAGGVIGMICPGRSVLISGNGVLNKNTQKYLFKKDADGRPYSVGKVMILGKNEGSSNTNKLKFGLLGDPSLRLPWPDLKIRVNEIMGVDISSASQLPVLQARGTAAISGQVNDAEGNLIEDFNGILEITLYDAEKVVTTKGNGADGEIMNYNDRKTRLYAGRVKVKDGRWSTIVNMPAEIENNFSPALLSLYAYDDTGREANGACDKLYVYGYNQDAPDDFEGPKIIEYYLNSPGFVSGQGVSPSPVVKAVFSDPSGISVSEAGIGHNMTLELDGIKFIDDLALYYEPDEEDPTKGSVSYPLSDLQPGKHELKFVVWDNANNSSSAILEFNVSALWKPSIERLTTDANPASTFVNFILSTDGAFDSSECKIEVFDLNGRKVWTGISPALNSGNTNITIGWNLCDSGGNRIPRGIYIYRATVSAPDSGSVSKTGKLAVTAP